MSEQTIELKIITHEKVVFDGKVNEFYADGVAGQFGILPGHTPFMSALKIGVLKTVFEGKEEFFSVIGGVLQFNDNKAVILTEDAENGKDIDSVAAQNEKEKLEAREGNEQTAKEVANADKALATALARFKAAAAGKQ